MKWFEVEELAVAALGYCADDELDSTTIGEKVSDRFGLDMQQFQKLAEALMPFMVSVPSEPVNAQLLAIATGRIEHDYNGECPHTFNDFKARDQSCPACQIISTEEALQASQVQLIAALNKRCYMFSEKHLSGYRIVLGFEALGDADEVIDQLSNRWAVKNQPRPCGD